MASSPSSSNPNPNMSPSPSTFDPNLPTNTTFVQADPTTFRTIVQKLTGAPPDPTHQKLPITLSARLVGKSPANSPGHRRSPFKLHERRQSARKLEIQLNHNSLIGSGGPRHRGFVGFGGGEKVMVSPVSPLDMLFARGSSSSSPRTPHSPIEEEEGEEEKAIAEKGFYLHPSPLSTPRGGAEPELLPLFPLHSPKD